MRVTFLNTFDDQGGAARAAFRTFRAVSALPGVETVFITRKKASGHPGVQEDRSPLTLLYGDEASTHDQRALKRQHPDRSRVPFSVNRLRDTVHQTVRGTRPDLVHLHWPNAGFLRLESLPLLGAPVVWTLHDMWPFTGVCHYSGGCQKYLQGCGACPLLASANAQDVSARVYARKAAAYAKTALHAAAPSHWLAQLARTAPLLAGVPVDVVPNGLDTEVFAPQDRTAARAALGLPREGRLVLLGADHALSDARKGCSALLAALAGHAGPESPPARCVVFGNTPEQTPAGNALLLGPLRDDRTLAQVYSACDLYAFPSTQDNLPNTVVEALACGLPVLAFDVGGLADLVRHGENGMLVKSPACDMQDFITALLNFPKGQQLAAMGRNARADALRRFSLSALGRRHETLYHAALARFVGLPGRTGAKT
ncbi:glycosyltransferase [Humidesulfovibrio sp.]